MCPYQERSSNRKNSFGGCAEVSFATIVVSKERHAPDDDRRELDKRPAREQSSPEAAKWPGPRGAPTGRLRLVTETVNEKG
jgi:hypothetical protein